MNPEYANKPIIALTANALKGDAEKYYTAGFNGYLTKPFNSKQLGEAILEVLKAADSIKKLEKKVPPKEVAGKAIFDISGFEKMARGDDAFLVKLITLFLETVSAALSKMKTLMESGNIKEIASQAHAIKPGFDMLDRNDITTLLRNMEKQAQKEDKVQVMDFLSALQSLWEPLKESLKKQI